MPARRDPALRTAVVFTALALGFAVLYWVVAELSRSGLVPFSMEQAGFARKSVAGSIVWLLLSNFGPALAGVLALALCRGRAAVADLGRSLVRWRLPGWLYVAGWFGLLVNAGVVLVAWPAGVLRFDPAAFAPVKLVLIFFVMAFVDGPLGEEIGWRGVLLPELLRRLSPLGASLVVGLVWYVWHVPLYAAEGRLETAGAHLLFLYGCLALSVVMTWFFLRSRGSVLLMVYLHDASNYATFLRSRLFPRIADSPLPSFAYAAVLFVLAALAGMALWRGRRVGAERVS